MTLCCYCMKDMGEAGHVVCEDCGNALCDDCKLPMGNDRYLCPGCEGDMMSEVTVYARIHAKVEARKQAEKDSA